MLQSYSDSTQQCTVNYGDQSAIDTFSVDGGILSKETTHSYPRLGLFPVTLSCTNEFGVTTELCSAPAAESGVPYENLALNADAVIAMNGAVDGSVVVYVDGTPVLPGNVVTNATHVRLVNSPLTATSGEHWVTLRQSSTGLLLLMKVYNVVRPVQTVAVATASDGVKVGETTTVTLTVQRGERMFVSLSYGDNQTELIYITEAPATVTRDHAYADLGSYNVTAVVANDVSELTASTIASIERKIILATMTVKNVTSLGAPVEFSFVVDPTVSPAMPISVTFEYGDDYSETVKLAAPYTHSYAYARSDAQLLNLNEFACSVLSLRLVGVRRSGAVCVLTCQCSTHSVLRFNDGPLF